MKHEIHLQSTVIKSAISLIKNFNNKVARVHFVHVDEL